MSVNKNDGCSIKLYPIRDCGLLLSGDTMTMLILHMLRDQHNVPLSTQNCTYEYRTSGTFWAKARIMSIPGLGIDMVEPALDWFQKQNPKTEVSMAPGFTGEVTALFPEHIGTTQIQIQNPTLPDGRLYWIRPEKEPGITHAAYRFPEELCNEFFRLSKNQWPDDFDWWGHIVSIYGIYGRLK